MRCKQRTCWIRPTIPIGTRITVVGEVSGSTTHPLDEIEYVYPTLEIKALTVWPPKLPAYWFRPYPYFGVYWGSYWGPYWGPYRGHGLVLTPLAHAGWAQEAAKRIGPAEREEVMLKHLGITIAVLTIVLSSSWTVAQIRPGHPRSRRGGL